MRLFLTLFLAVLSLGLRAQSIGVVFSGGGAKGLYHIGILKALEENGIPIDYISGTSQGAIVAGLYASGYSPAEIERIFVSDQVKTWLSGKIESDYSFYFKQMEEDQSMLTINLDLKAKKNIAVLPINIIPSSQLDLAFSRFFSPVTAATGGDFDRLFIPFRCVAADVYNKREVVFRGGDLGEAIRASMTIPMVFKPLMIDSVLLFDGGMANNFPYQVLDEDFRPDLLIGGKCIVGKVEPDETNLLAVIEMITMARTDFDLPADRGILIERVFDDVSMMDYSRAQYIIETGYRDALEMMDSIRGRVVRRVDPAALHHRRLEFRASLPELMFDDVRVSGLTADQSHFLRRMLGVSMDGSKTRPFNFDEFKSEYFKILSEGEVQSEYPLMHYDDTTGYFTVDLPLTTRPSFRVRVGGNISSAALNQAYVGLEYKTIGRSAHSFRVDGNFSGLYNAFRGGWRTDFMLRGPVYVDLFFNYNKYNYQRGPNWTVFDKYGYHGYQDTYVSTSFGLPLGRSSALQFRINAGIDRFNYYERKYITESYGSSDRTRFRYYGAQVEATKRTLNYKLFATRGIWQSVSAIAVKGEESFTPGEHFDGEIPERIASRSWFGGKYTREEYFPLRRWFSAGYLIEAVFTPNPRFYNDHATNFIQPGFTPTPYSQSLYMDKFRSYSYLGIGIMPTIEFTDNFYLKSGIYLYAPGDYFFYGREPYQKIRHIFSSSLVYQTPIGPASLTLTNFEETSRRWYIAFNLGFTLFNKRGTFY
jgi:NTE family protein